MDDYRMENGNWTILLQLVTSVGSVAALAALMRVRNENLKLKAEAASIVDSINDRVFERMGKLNQTLIERLTTLETRLAAQEIQIQEADSKISFLQDTIDDLERDKKRMRETIKRWQAGISKLADQFVERDMVPVWLPSEEDLKDG